jgi:hypothetical protein
MSPFYLTSNTLKVWESSFEPYLDPTQWPPYLGLDYVPDLDLVRTKKGRRKKKWLRGVIDESNGYGKDKYGYGDFNEAAGQVRCSKCHRTGHTATTHDRAMKALKLARAREEAGPSGSKRRNVLVSFAILVE